MTPDKFTEIYDAAMESRSQIFQAICEFEAREGFGYIGGINMCYLIIGNTINYCITLIPQPGELDTISVDALPYGMNRDCTAEEIRQATARALAEMRKLTTEGRIAALKEKIAKIERGEGER